MEIQAEIELPKKAKNLTNQRFGKLIALYPCEKDKLSRIHWFCQCDCGNLVSVLSTRLATNHTKSCGCYAIERIREVCSKDLTGMVFTNLTVLGRSKEKQRHWNCICSCGKNCIVMGSSLVQGKTKSCGCLHKNRIKKTYGYSSFHSIFCSYKSNAKSRGLEFSLTEEEFKKLASSNCFYCNQKPSNISKSNSNNGEYVYNGIDRVNNLVGYSLSNCVSCCTQCNLSKKDYSQAEFYMWIENVYNHIINKSIEYESR